MSPTVAFQPVGRVVEVDPEETVWAATIRAAVPLASTCGGQGICGKCKVRVLHGSVSPLTQAESDALSAGELEAGYRLACEIRPLTSIVVETPLIQEDKRSKVTLLDLGGEFEVAPGLSKRFALVPRPSLADPRTDVARLTATLTGFGLNPPQIDLQVQRSLPHNLRQARFHVTVTLHDDRLVAIEPGDTSRDFYGLAVDLGTTTVAGYLMHLTTGQKVAAAATANRQATFGDDVMSRLSFAMSGGLEQLQQTAITVINDLVGTVCEMASISPSAVSAMVVTGNTTMLHFLSGLPTDHLGVAPYVAVNLGQTRSTAAQLGLAIHPQAPVWLLPGVGAYAGADCVSSALAAGFAQNREPRLLIDFGTNAEIVLATPAGIWACATAAGPAFEGARIKHGMRAAPGAIDRVWVQDGTVQVRTIDRKRPVGITGTGLVSAVAALRQAGVIDNRGLFCEQHRLSPDSWVPSSDHRGMAVRLVRPTRTRDAITLSQADIGEFQLAKAAVRAGIDILLNKANLDSLDICQVLLAGAFGSFMSPADALAADLLPHIPVEHVLSLGNAAGLGAAMALLSAEKRAEGRQLARAIHYVELSTEPDFNRRFAQLLPFDTA